MTKQSAFAMTVVFAFLLVPIGCTSETPLPAEKENAGASVPATETPAPPAMTEEPAGGDQVLQAASESPGQAENASGIDHFNQGHWDVAEGHFKKAIEADPNLAEAHYNLAVALDKMGNHGDATTSFHKAAELAPDNPAIAESAILKQHTGG